MQKPTVFFSHSSIDAQVLANLKELVNARTGQTIDIFLSSDGQSIPFGSNWVYKIEEALTDSTIMFVFISPSSINSRWIYFESGFAYAKGADVIPVGILGVNLNQVNPPLSLLQGFNLDKTDALGNLIAKINEKFDYSFDMEFSDKDFTQTFHFSENPLILETIESLNFQIESEDKQISTIIKNELASNNIETVAEDDLLWVNGMSIGFEEFNAMVVIDGLSMIENLKLIQEIITKNNLKIKDDNFTLFFENKYILSSGSYLRQSALLSNSEIKISKNLKFVYQDITFILFSTSGTLGSVRMSASIKREKLTSQWINEVCRIILDNGILVIDPNYEIKNTLLSSVGLISD